MLAASAAALTTGYFMFSAFRFAGANAVMHQPKLQSFAAVGASLIAASLAAAHAFDATHFFRIFVQDWCNARNLKKNSVVDTDKVEYRCWPTDIDRNGHMNNAKFLRALNYARRSFWSRNGGWDFVTRRTPKANMVVTASTIRYRREIRCWMVYNVATRLLHWDGQNFYLEHRFENPEDGFCLAVCFVKYRLISEDKASAASVLGVLDAAVRDWSPTPSPELAAWISYDELSSKATKRSD